MTTGIDLGLVTTFFVAALGVQVSKYLKLPAAISLILVGLIFGPAFLNIVQVSPITTFLANIGIILMLFKVGLESEISLLKSKGTLFVGAAGFILPWILGYGVTCFLGYDGYEAFFVGVILTATSIGITMSILEELRMTDRPFARIILGAAVIDDVLGLIALSLAITIVQAGTVSVAEIMRIALFSIGVIVIAVILGIKLLSLIRTFPQKRLSEGAMYLLIISLALLAAVLAEEIGLSAIVGAFLAGLVITEAKFYQEYAKLHETLNPLVALFAPLFFLQIGLLIHRTELLTGVYFGLLLTLVAIIGKYLGCYYASKGTKIHTLDSMLIGFGMLPRGEVALVAAQIGLTFAIISPGVLSAVVIMSLLTSIIPPVLFLYILSPYRAATPDAFEVERKKVEERFSIIYRLQKHLARKMPRKRSRKKI